MSERSERAALQTRIEGLESQLAECEARFRSQSELLKDALTEKGKMMLVDLARAKAQAVAQTETARRDPTTGFLRHGAMRARLEFEVVRSRRAAEPLGFLLVDLDNFAAVNAALGYEEGDRVLAFLAQSLPSIWLADPPNRPPVFGWEAGDCLGVILPEASHEETEQRGEAVRQLVERLPVGPPRLTCSMGVSAASAPQIATVDAAVLIEVTTAALARAQAEGGNRIAWADLAVAP